MQNTVLSVLKKSKRLVTRGELQYVVFGTSTRLNHNYDRAIQRIIRELRLLGFVIVSNSRSAGYRLASTDAEVNHYLAEQLKRAREIRNTALRVKRAHNQRRQMALKV
jgi:hypothetical protein